VGLREEIEDRGFAFRRQALDSGQLRELLSLLFPGGDAGPEHRAPHALRNVLWDCDGVARALARFGVDGLAGEALGGEAFPINALYFDKTAGANWKVPCHQDLMVPVAGRAEESGFSGWSEKAGVVHVEPPCEVLERLVAIRIHFDDCSAHSGALSVLPGSHRGGKLRDAQLVGLDRRLLVDCEGGAGDVLLMKPLLVHRSSAAEDPSHRRVLHVVYAVEEPGASLRWKRPAPGRSAVPGPP
jgi:hypothetical protein